MKKTILTSAFVLLTACLMRAEGMVPVDTTFQFNQKYIEIKEDSAQIKVKVFVKNEVNDTVQYKQLYEGIYSDEKTYEKWTVQEVIGFDIPFIRNKKKQHSLRMEPHWNGVGLGFANIADRSLNMTNVDGVTVDAGSSHEWFINIGEKIVPVYRNKIGITTGIGMSWLNLRLDNNTRLIDVDGVTGVYPAPENVQLSRLMITRINVPLLLEWQPAKKAFVSAGVVGGVKTFSSFLVKYREVTGTGNRTVKEKDRGLNTTPLYLDYMVQAGYDSFSIYAKYSPFSIFQTNKGPDVRAVSLGFILHFND